jgi:peroxin-19
MDDINPDELDNILDAALEEFEEEEQRKISAASTGGERGADSPSADQLLKTQQVAAVTSELHKMISDLENPVHGETLRRNYGLLSGRVEGAATVEQFIGQLREQERVSAQGHPDAPQREMHLGGATDVDLSVAQTLEMLAESAKDMEGMSSAQVEGHGEEMMNAMMAEFEKLGEKEDFNHVVDGMMRQLLSKELMYEPMKQVCEKYPEWLAVQAEALGKDDYERYGTQYQYFQRIVAVYETEPDNFARLMELMQDVQQYGQPPAEIIKDLAPGLEFNEEGMPIMPGLGPGTLPAGLPGMPGIPFPESMPDGQPCALM